ncbi:MAG TPA: hypothetical protein VFV19_18105 [Candidatus Polarisedimenticolaceae bacterium]|nr:hypothetical protein [Candidatus Polarisedimenticolaceae bacterium]
MKKLLSMGLLAVALVGLSALCWTPAAQAAKPGGGGGCSTCSGTTPVCCYGCNGAFAFCSRSHAFCPECPAP